MSVPLVSICSITYNHAPYIRQCLEGFVMQKTNFPFEIIINDDCSTDGTTEIVKEYAEKYPDLIKPVFHEENQYSKGVKVLATYVYPKAKGKYIALCEGDDYWIYPMKLQKQVDILESDDNVMLVHTGFKTINEFGEDIPWPKYQHFQEISKKEKGILSLFDKNHIMTLTTMFRKEVMTSKLLEKSPYRYDYASFFTAALMGKIRYLPFVTAAYRKTPTGAMQSRANMVNKHLYEIYQYFLKYYLNSGMKMPCAENLEATFFMLTNILYNNDKETLKFLLQKKNISKIILPISWIYAMAKKVKNR